MNKPPSIEDRIRTALVNPNIGSEVLVEIIQEVEQAAATADQTIIAERAKLLDVTACRDPDQARERIAVLTTSRDRLLATNPRLKAMLTTALAAEAGDRWSADYRKVKAKLDEAVLLFRDYLGHAETIAAMFGLAVEVDREVSRINGSAPDNEHKRLQSVELTARGMSAFTRENPSLAANTVLPRWDNSARNLWPARPSTTLAAMASGMNVPHPGGAWADPEVRAQRRTEVEKSQRELGEYHEQAARDEEDRKNREERERALALKR